ncbi:DNA-binding transcriptional regulator SgrR of sgrS sRNA, contains a MarR-type HTH domain and a solute-binding domain [Marininema mesophilum]|uniref:DNA-binding transcriptional regulator SgrR of sgrS sRNA, contains a MarR-type HTH domain and a solute-binding domain n=1 Tax=Marininema mesophilum TaxID=1048340 RepID=A0A1H2Q130_9BACL|nr:ABC transporter substrate-binding protein [Marininema mesophilum]SDW00825.1 DNA-binding transcriptional regulator SgrR of sgrS sRNA, contains a MarR-type HTH domain and a solute-binding domain [Marininema mesophilum]
MKVTEHYLTIRLAHLEAETHVEVKTSLKKIVQVLNCTRRNAQGVLNKLEEREWIRWKPGRGRGNHSQLTFLRPLTTVVESYIEEQFEHGRFEEAMTFLNTFTLPPHARTALTAKLGQRFGFQTGGSTMGNRHILRIPRYRGFATMDPVQVYTASECHFVRQMYDTLLRYHPARKRVLPHLALGWDTKDDMKWTFYLRKGVRFHHGRSLIAEDVAHTFQRLIDPQISVLSWLSRYLENVIVLDPHTVQFQFNRPIPFFPRILCAVNTAITPYDVDILTKAIGTGPFVMRTLTEQKLILVAFEDYFNGRAWLDQVEILRVPKEIHHTLNYQMVTAETQYTEEDIEQESETIKRFRKNSTQMLIFHTNLPGPQQDRSFRKAIRLALDRHAMVRALGANRLSPANSFFPDRSDPSFIPSGTLAEAKEALAKSTYQGEKLTLIYHYPSQEQWEDIRWIQQRCAQIGVAIELLHKPLETFNLGNVQQKKVIDQGHMFIVDEVLDQEPEMSLLMFLAISTLLHQLLDSEKKEIASHYIDRFIMGKTSAERMAIWGEIEDWFHRDHLFLFQYHLNREATYPSSLQKVRMESFGWIDFRKLWVKPRSL